MKVRTMWSTTIFWAFFLQGVCVPMTTSRLLATQDKSWEDTSPEEGPFLEGDIVIGSETIPVGEFGVSCRLPFKMCIVITFNSFVG